MVKASTATLVQPEFLLVSIDELRPSPTNPRKFIDQNSLQELTDSIRMKGILVPLIVRPVGGNHPYEIVAGERRYRAAKAADVYEIPARVVEMSDEEVLEAQQIENLQREDVHPLDEADGYGRLLDAGNPVHTIALKLGKPIDYITRRLKLRTLTDLSRQAFTEKLITVDHALLLSKLGPAEQDEALRYTLYRGASVKTKTEQILADARDSAKEKGDYGGYWEPSSVADLREHIESALNLELKKAPWDLADADLVASAGACTTCPSNTAANTALFGDLAIEKATCTDSACFNAKRQAFVQLQVEAIADAGKASVKISHKHSSAKPRFLKDGSGPDLATTFKKGQWVDAKKGECDNVITGVTVDFDEGYGGTGKPGVKKSVCVAAKCKAHRKDYEATSSKGPSRSAYDPKAEAERRKKLEAAANEERQIRVGNTIEAMKHVKKLTPEILRGVAIELTGYGDENLKNIVGVGIKSKLQTIETDSVDFARILVGLLVKGMLDANAWTDNHAPERKRLFATLKELTGFDAAAQQKKQPAPKKVKK